MEQLFEVTGFVPLDDLKLLNVKGQATADQLEVRAETYYRLLLTHYGDQRSIREGIRELAAVYYQDLVPHLSASSSDKFHTYVVLIRLFQYACVHDYVSILPICDQLLETLQKSKSTNETLILICLHYKLIGYIQLGDFRNGMLVIQQSDQLIEEGTWNWFKNKECLLLLAMRTGRYQYALEVFQEVDTHHNRHILTEDLNRYWELYRAYLALLLSMGEISDPELPGSPLSISNRLFTEELGLIPVNTDWMVPNLSIQTLHLLINEEYDQLSSLLKKVEQSNLKWWLQADNRRSYWLIKLLLLLPQVGYSRQQLLEKGMPLVRKMVTKISDSAPLQYSCPRVEIIPYETLWRMLLKILK